MSDAATILRYPTPPEWVAAALLDFDAVLRDHAHLEKKAAASAMSLVSQYFDHGELVRRLSKLAQEELRHFYQVHELLLARGLTLDRDRGDPYARALVSCIRSGSHAMRRLDRLLVAGLIEARSCERLALLGDALEDPELKSFYVGLSKAEAGHYTLFVELAQRYEADPHEVKRRLTELVADEAAIVAGLPVEARLH